MEAARINATELRIGNIVQSMTEYEAYIIRVSAICETCIHTPSGKRHCSIAYKALRCVPLSVDVLVSWCGFTPDKELHVFRKGRFRIIFDSEERCAYAVLGRRKYPITSLHRLQNLYHATTGDELNVSPTRSHIVIKPRPEREPLDILLRRDIEKIRRIKEMRKDAGLDEDTVRT